MAVVAAPAYFPGSSASPPMSIPRQDRKRSSIPTTHLGVARVVENATT